MPKKKTKKNPEPSASNATVYHGIQPNPLVSGEVRAHVDNVNHPSHYTQGGIEVIDMIVSMGDGEAFCRANAIKYLSRYKHKNGLEDLKKARWYLNKLIDLEGAKE